MPIRLKNHVFCFTSALSFRFEVVPDYVYNPKAYEYIDIYRGWYKLF